ncbi:HAD-IA family hydrolase [Rhodococcus sp. 114MFTsu3.1]|uniref:HAD-IA family hydrolase n=1 Tax=Rhodococcus sp. 114MFTsu3.1 TaxID=1172184 RepID=UPI00037C5F20|nr:HAD-IA family hydrolase [Rhodococcus sp. 114MFTsu3.1]
MTTQDNALIFDCDGVLADTERFGHLPAFNKAFDDAGIPLHWTEQDYAELVKIGGGKERITAALDAARTHGNADDERLQTTSVPALHKAKTEIYRAMVSAGVMPPRPGVARLIRSALAAGWKVAVASTSAPESVKSVLDSVVGTETASAIPIFAGDIVPAKKPAPDIYEIALAELGVTAEHAVVIEDSAVGLQAAVSAGLTCIVTPSSYTLREDFTFAAAVVTSLGEPSDPLSVISDRYAVDFGLQSMVTIDSLERLLKHRNVTRPTTKISGEHR